MGFPIRISADQSLFAAPHGFSQRTTSFIACACQGIHRTPLRHLIALIFNARPHYPRSSKQAGEVWTACFKSIAEQTMDPRPASHPKAQNRSRKTSVTRELSVGGALAPSAFARLPKETSGQFFSSRCQCRPSRPAKIRKQKSARRETLPTYL